jgi:hypothetical protein
LTRRFRLLSDNREKYRESAGNRPSGAPSQWQYAIKLNPLREKFLLKRNREFVGVKQEENRETKGVEQKIRVR